MRHWIFLLLFTPSLSTAQDELDVWFTPASRCLFPEESAPVHVLVAVAVMRAAPTDTAHMVDELPLGTAVMVLETGGDTITLNGIRSTWYRVQAKGKLGWLWGGLLAQDATGSHADATVKFIGGLDHVSLEGDTSGVKYHYRLRALQNGKEVATTTLPSFAWKFGALIGLGSMGLSTTDDVLLLDVPCVGGCGCTTGNVVVFWSGGQFHHVADMMGSPDGVYSTNQTLVFPSDMAGLPGIIQRITSSYDDSEQAGGEQLASDGDKPAKPLLRRIMTTEFLRWDGVQLISTGQVPVERSYLMPTD